MKAEAESRSIQHPLLVHPYSSSIHYHGKCPSATHPRITNRTSYPQSNLSLYTVTALLILDSEGQRVFAKYYNPPHQAVPATGIPAELGVGAGGPGMGGLLGFKEQKAFEKSVFDKIRRGAGASSLQLHYQFLSSILIEGMINKYRRDLPSSTTHHPYPLRRRPYIHHRRPPLLYQRTDAQPNPFRIL